MRPWKPVLNRAPASPRCSASLTAAVITAGQLPVRASSRREARSLRTRPTRGPVASGRRSWPCGTQPGTAPARRRTCRASARCPAERRLRLCGPRPRRRPGRRAETARRHPRPVRSRLHGYAGLIHALIGARWPALTSKRCLHEDKRASKGSLSDCPMPACTTAIRPRFTTQQIHGSVQIFTARRGRYMAARGTQDQGHGTRLRVGQPRRRRSRRAVPIRGGRPRRSSASAFVGFTAWTREPPVAAVACVIGG